MALKPLNSVGGFSVGEIPSNVIYANGDFSGNKANFTGNLAALGVLTDNLYYANGTPWDLQEAAGSNTQIQFNDNNNFGASANFTFDSATNLLTVGGNAQFNNANLGNLAIANYINVSNSLQTVDANVTGNLTAANVSLTGNITVPNLTVNNEITGNTANFSGNIIVPNLTVNNEISGNTANFSGNVIVPNLTVNTALSGNTANFSGNVILPNLTVNTELSGNTANFSGNVVSPNLTVNLELAGNTANFTGNVEVLGLLTDNLYYANGQPWDLQEAAGSNYEIQFNLGNDFAASANLTFNDTTNLLTVNGNAQFNNANLGNLATANYVNVSGNTTTDNLTVNSALAGNTANFSGNVILPNLTVNLELAGNTANFTGNVSAQNAALGNLATANFVNVSSNTITNNLTVNSEISGNTANFSGNITTLNANLGNLATANYINVANDLNVVGNITGGNIIGALANGNSNVKVYSNSNVEISVAGIANVVTFTSDSLLVAGNIQSTTGNILANGNVIANGFLNSANANVTGQAELGSVLTANITAPVGNITISAAGVDQDIILAPTGNGAVDLGLHKIIQLGGPINPNDAATKEYVDNIAQGLSVHNPVRVTSTTNLNATYNNGGTALTTTDITGGKTIQFSANHGLSVGDEIYWTSSFNGIVAYNAYFVYSTPALNQITVKDGFFGTEVTTLTNGTGLSQAALGNPGVGATLTNAGANVALQIDSVPLASTNRVLVQGQTNGFENGVYTVTTVGDGSTAWVLTRAADENTYDPKSTTGLAYGDYFFVQEGTNAAGSSYVVNSPVGEILFGVTNIGFTQFSAAGAYTAGNGIAINGTIISANVDLDTTDIVGGNIVVKSGANLTTPNIGDATFSSLTWNTLSNGNVSANNLSIGNIANITLDLTVGGNIQANGTISSNANVSGLNLTTNGNIEAGGNVLAGNITANSTVFTANANVSGTTITDALTVNNAISGNTANFTGNITAGNISTSGSGGNITGANVVSANTFSGNIVGTTANFSGNANVGGILTDNYYYANGAPVDFQQAAGSNTYIQYNDNNNFGASANFTYDDGTQVFAVNGTANVITANVSGNVNVGNSTVNTAITWGSLTTTSITANQTIASFNVTGVTGVEFLVKGIDSTGSKYSVATVTAVTDGSNVDYSTFGTVNLGGFTGSLAVNVSGGAIRLQVTPSSSNSTVWTTQYRVI